MIEIKNLIHEYHIGEKTVRAVDGVSLTIEQGEHVAILGHNGSGKSTLAKHLNAILLPGGGSVFVDGMDTCDGELLWDIRQRVGMVFQNPDNQIIATIVEDDVAFGPENLAVDSAEIRSRVDDSLRSVGLYDKKDAPPHFLSGGQKQRLAIAGIIAMLPKYIVLDEPTAMLDPSGRREVINTITELNRKAGLTVINITHFMEEAVMADRIVVMEKGRIVMEGKPAEVFTKVEELRRYRLDVPPVTELAHLLASEIPGFPEDILTIEEMVETVCRLK